MGWQIEVLPACGEVIVIRGFECEFRFLGVGLWRSLNPQELNTLGAVVGFLRLRKNHMQLSVQSWFLELARVRPAYKDSSTGRRKWNLSAKTVIFNQTVLHLYLRGIILS